jgi:transposase-like protein
MNKTPAIKPKMTLPVLNVDFDTDAECRQALEELRWPDGVTCPRCQSESISRITTRKQFDCNACRYRFSVTTGTIFNDSHLPLPKWFMAIFLMCESKKGISSMQLKRMLGVSKKTAWYLNHRIREAMRLDAQEPLEGTIEVDETYIGGKPRYKVGSGSYHTRKEMVLAAIQRGGDIRLQHVKKDFEKGKKVRGFGNRKTLHKFINDCAPNPERIITDEHPAYPGIADEDTVHETVNHSEKEYVRGDIHTNTIEGAFGLFKRSIVGSFHQISVKHLDRYLDEFEFRFNNRKNGYLFRDTLTRLVTAKALPYQKLTA